MFDGLQSKLQDVFKQIRGEGRVNEETLRAALRQIRFALLEADVHVRVVKPFLARVEERALGKEVLDSLTPAQQVVKIVRDEIVALLGEEGTELRLTGRPAVVLLCGLQGSGKTTTAGKIALRLKKNGRHPVLAAGDLQRAAAVEQLVQVGAGVSVPVITATGGENVVALARRVVKEARERGHDTVIFDTAGRLHVDAALMDELKAVAGALAPDEILFVADSMTGQDAVKSAGEFAAALPLTGAILTKLDGDSRGGAALSIRTVAGVPLRFVGVGEKAADLELFRPDRLASRMLGMGDVLSLIEKAEQGMDRDEAERLAQRIVKQEFTLEDLRDQLRQIRKMGPLGQLMEMMPKVGPFKGLKGLDSSQVDDRELRRIEAIINSMTREERRRPEILSGNRRLRVAKGSGTQVQDVNRLLKQYKMMRKMMKGMKGGFLERAMGGALKKKMLGR
jgi:signal recognition particle subunit SRP54